MAGRHPRAQTPLPTKKEWRLELWIAVVALVIGLVIAIWFTRVRHRAIAPASATDAAPTAKP